MQSIKCESSARCCAVPEERGHPDLCRRNAVPPREPLPCPATDTSLTGVVVGDGAVGKVSATVEQVQAGKLNKLNAPDMSLDLIHDQFVPGGVSDPLLPLVRKRLTPRADTSRRCLIITLQTYVPRKGMRSGSIDLVRAGVGRWETRLAGTMGYRVRSFLPASLRN
jgi:hypothetical protein